jgi:hypothetical protein
MSTTDETYRAICRAGFFLESVRYRKRIPLDMKMESHRILRHFPGVVELEEIFKGKQADKMPNEVWKDMKTELEFLREKWGLNK